MAYKRERWHSLALQGESPARSPKRAKVVQTRAQPYSSIKPTGFPIENLKVGVELPPAGAQIRIPVLTDRVAGYWKETALVP